MSSHCTDRLQPPGTGVGFEPASAPGKDTLRINQLCSLHVEVGYKSFELFLSSTFRSATSRAVVESSGLAVCIDCALACNTQ